MPDAPEDPIHTWGLIAEGMQDGVVRSVVQLGTEMGADVSVTLRIPGDDRYLTVSFGHLGPDEEDETDGA